MNGYNLGTAIPKMEEMNRARYGKRGGASMLSL